MPNWLLRPGAIVRASQNALEKRIQTGHQDVLLAQSRRLARTITWTLIGGTGCALAWLALAQTEEVVIAPGKLEPQGQVKTVQLPIGGVLEEMLVSEGQKVKKGQVLLKLDNDASASRELELRRSLQAKQMQLQLKQEEMKRYLNLNASEQSVTRQTLKLESQIASRLDQLQKQGATAELQALQQRNKVREMQGTLSKLELDRGRQIAILSQQIQQLEGELAELRSRLTESTTTLRYQDLRSPVDGIVFDLKPKGPGFVAQGSEPVMQIVPTGGILAKVEIPSDKIGFVRTGQKVDISIDSFPSSDFGVLHGTVTRVSSDALPPDELKQSYRFPAVITLSSQTLKLRSGKQLPLQVGMSLSANIKLRKVSYLQLLLGDLTDKTKSLQAL